MENETNTLKSGYWKLFRRTYEAWWVAVIKYTAFLRCSFEIDNLTWTNNAEYFSSRSCCHQRMLFLFLTPSRIPRRYDKNSYLLSLLLACLSACRSPKRNLTNDIDILLSSFRHDIDLSICHTDKHVNKFSGKHNWGKHTDLQTSGKETQEQSQKQKKHGREKL